MNAPAAPLVGVVLAGGASTRMGRDKASVTIGGMTQAERLVTLLSTVCGTAVLSVRPAQACGAPYRHLPLLEDAYPPHGPVTGLLTAARAFPGMAILAVAVDTLVPGQETVSALLGRRRPDKDATVPYLEAENVFEPLFAVYEPRALSALSAAAKNGEYGIRAVLRRLDVEKVPAESLGMPGSFNTEEELQGRMR